MAKDFAEEVIEKTKEGYDLKLTISADFTETEFEVTRDFIDIMKTMIDSKWTSTGMIKEKGVKLIVEYRVEKI